MKFFSTLILSATYLFAHTPCEEEAATAPAFPYWKSYLNGGFDVNQSNFNNWQAGGEDALTWQSVFDGGIAYLTEMHLWENEIKLAYGRTKIGDAGSRKSLDELNATTRYTYKLTQFLNPYASVNFQTQMTSGFEYPKTEEGVELPKVKVSDFLNPGILIESVGLGTEPINKLIIRLGGAIKHTFAEERYGFADDEDTADLIETLKTEPGTELSIQYAFNLAKALQLKTKLYSFTNYEGVKEIDASFENALISQISDWFQVTLGYDLLYDRDIDKSYQAKSLISLGLHYSFL